MRCAVCGRTARTQCGRCKKEVYCDKECQAQHWKVHKAVCRPAPPRRVEELIPLCGKGFRAWLARSSWRQQAFPSCLEEPGVGITNWSNNCYLSAVCQCLLQTPMLRQHLRDTCHEPPEDPWLAELLGLCRLVDGARRKGARYVDLPRRLTRLITDASEEFAFGRQADAHEALMLLISRWLAGCVKAGDGSGADCSKLGYSEKEQLEASSLIGHVFGMLMGSRIACASCSYESLVTRVEYCLCLTVTLGMTDEELQKCRQESAQQLNRWCLRRPGQGPRQDSSASPTSLANLLDEYTKDEHIPDYKCEKCHNRGAYRTAFVRRRPNALVVYIDRRQDTNLFGKINRRVSFPMELDLSRWIPEEDMERFGEAAEQGAQYHLYAMCVHHDLRGSTASGHYVAYARDRNDRWYQLDDEIVRQVQRSDVEEQHPYLLFYMADKPVELGEPVPAAEEKGGLEAEAVEPEAEVQAEEAKEAEDSTQAQGEQETEENKVSLSDEAHKASSPNGNCVTEESEVELERRANDLGSAADVA
mmetsp:Transcript_65603/g.154293  ORF Transcript_65603/g.154293 Transcript_65603/m.154293 type:complete len:531 (-) Transcript_65603:190-1782(-)